MTWTKSAIRLARKVELAPLLVERGYRLYPLSNGNFRILPDPDNPGAPAGVIVKLNFWTWSEKDIAGNTIDFFTQVEGKTFHQAMQIITEQHHDDLSEQNLREEHGNVSEILR